MNIKISSFIKNLSYTIVSNLMTLLISTLIALIIPKIIGIYEYGYWQLFIFYSSYIGFLHFGWIDGIYLRYGGYNYKSLDKNTFSVQFIMLICSQLIISLIILTFNNVLVVDINRNFIIKMIALTVIIVNARTFFLYILQATNKIESYARITILDRLIYISIILLFIFNGLKQYQLMIIADVVAKIISLFYSIYICKDIFDHRIRSFRLNFKEMFANISVGIRLMLANIASMLIIGIVRYGIEIKWGVYVFGKVSLVLSISNMTLLFINAVGIILYPVLRRADKEKLHEIYMIMRNCLMPFLFGILILYYPMVQLLSKWLPHYSDSLAYMSLTFPIFIYEGKMALLLNTFFKTLREETMMFKINVLTMICSLAITIIATLIFNNLNLAILNIVLLLFVKILLSEIYLSKILGIGCKKDVILETILIIVFISTGWFIGSAYAILLYGLAYLGYCYFKNKDIRKSIISMKILLST